MTKLDWHQDLSSATAIWVRYANSRPGEEWVWQKEKNVETHHPMDRVGGPFGLSDFVDEGSGEHLFVFSVVDCAFPIYDLVRADSWEDAYEAYIDWAASHRHLAIQEPDLKDYKEENLQYTSDGVPVDTDNVNGWEAVFVRADGIVAEAES